MHQILRLNGEALLVGGDSGRLNAVGKRHDAAHKVSQRRAAHKLLEKRQQPQFVRGMRNLQILCRVVAQQRCKLEHTRRAHFYNCGAKCCLKLICRARRRTFDSRKSAVHLHEPCQCAVHDGRARSAEAVDEALHYCERAVPIALEPWLQQMRSVACHNFEWRRRTFRGRLAYLQRLLDHGISDAHINDITHDIRSCHGKFIVLLLR
mmetsp:Transcript_91414/g.133655  ORF Transcript_91414/g.133655 Transcript_91414/m.133655 type:complete len:207 (-) Transcript_91414:1050-1670(-)